MVVNKRFGRNTETRLCRDRGVTGGADATDIQNVPGVTHALTYAWKMTSIFFTKARTKLYQLLDAAAGSHEPIQITGKRSNAVLVSEEDWRNIQETLYLMSIPGMRDSIRKGMAEPLKKASTKPGW